MVGLQCIYFFPICFLVLEASYIEHPLSRDPHSPNAPSYTFVLKEAHDVDMHKFL